MSKNKSVPFFPGEAGVGRDLQLLVEVLEPQVVLLVEQGVHVDQEGEAPDLAGVQVGLLGEEAVAQGLVPGQEVLHPVDVRELEDPL